MMPSMPIGRWLAGALGALALGAAACGADGGERAPTARGDDAEPAKPSQRMAPAPRSTPDAEVDPADVRVVRGWADTLRRGDVPGASRYFAVPSVVSNGTRPIRLHSVAEVRFFNRTLPCGAELIDTEPAAHGFFIATFRLTERPGPGRCGSGTGETARTAFRVRDEHITDWVRVQDVPSAPETLS